MFSFFRGRRTPRRRRSSSVYPSSSSRRRPRPLHDPRVDSDGDGDDGGPYADDGDDDDDDAYTQNEDDAREYDEENAPLLPIFSAAVLDALPVYEVTHAVRRLIVQRCETTLSWDQLRSPQISQFLVKPIQTQIKSAHFNRATLYCLLANCLQFTKESQAQPGNVGVLSTRASLAELLAMRLLKEYSTRELIDALSYDFDPLTGSAFEGAARLRKTRTDQSLLHSDSARTSTLEVSIRAQAKRFLAHPLVVQHLEAIWAGSIVFHHAADGLHRHPIKPLANHHRHYGALHAPESPGLDRSNAGGRPDAHLAGEPVRRSVTLYDPSNASLFKLSRLRVPKYRQIFSTVSYAILLGLFVAVLMERSLDITALEVLFWLWSAGFVLDEVIAYNEQGFLLYIQSVWNAFDIGILLFFLAYYLLRLYGIIIYNDAKDRVAEVAYDVLASTAVLLFPRLFSLLDYYRYWSQLFIAFRLMAQDLLAVLFLAAISCSGFFVAFSLAFGGNWGGIGVAYALFQIVLGFTPAAWNVWSQQNILGQCLLTVFLIICHFLLVTILVSVLTNSFMAIVQNANEEHQYLFAVNVISMVKSDALFSYVAPSNLLGWAISPLRYIVPFRYFVRVNRTAIKITHFPILFLIFAYERVRLAQYDFEPTRLIEKRGRSEHRVPTFMQGSDAIAHGTRLRETSVATYRKDRALEEVFRRPLEAESTTRRQRGRQKQASVVDEWMSFVGNVGGAAPPSEQPRSVLEQLETTLPRRPRMQRAMTSQPYSAKRRAVSRSAMSTLSDRDESVVVRRRDAATPTRAPKLMTSFTLSSTEEVPQQTDADGDDELMDEDDDDDDDRDRSLSRQRAGSSDKENTDGAAEMQRGLIPSTALGKQAVVPSEPSGSLRSASTIKVPAASSPGNFAAAAALGSMRKKHDRHSSVNTIVFSPLPEEQKPSPPVSPIHARLVRRTSRPSTSMGPAAMMPSRQSSPSKQGQKASKPRPIAPQRQGGMSQANLARFAHLSQQSGARQASFDAVALDLASDIGDNRHYEQDNSGFTVGSFQTQMVDAMRRRSNDEEATRMSRIVLTRMNTLEEGFKDILKEVKEWRNSNAGSPRTSAGEESGPGARLARRLERRQREVKEVKANDDKEEHGGGPSTA